MGLLYVHRLLLQHNNVQQRMVSWSTLSLVHSSASRYVFASPPPLPQAKGWVSKAEALEIKKFFLTPQSSQAAEKQWRVACDNVRAPPTGTRLQPPTGCWRTTAAASSLLFSSPLLFVSKRSLPVFARRGRHRKRSQHPDSRPPASKRRRWRSLPRNG